MHILLLISVLLVIISSTLLALVFEKRRIYPFLCYFGAISFAQIVLCFQILSIFSAINPVNIIISNVIMLIISILLWNFKKHKPEFSDSIKDEYEKFKLALKQDKWLKYVSFAFLICIIGSVIFMYVMPANDEDALSYHVARLPFWYSAKNLNHFLTADIRALIMPINSEIFYFWAYSFIKSNIFVRLFSFLSYLLFIVALRGFLKELNFSMKVSLWTIFSVSAMQNVMFSITGTESNIAIASLMLSSLYLFVLALKENKLSPIYFAALMYALAIGTKTPSLQAGPSLFVIATVIAVIYKKGEFYKPLLCCGAFLLINFLIFGSYNYFLNLVDFANPFSSPNAAAYHSFYGGFKGFVANIIRYSTMFVDFTGFPFGVFIWRLVTAFSMLLMALLGIQPDCGVISPETKYFELGNNFENMCGLGVLGFLLFIPAIIIAVKKMRSSNRSKILGTIAVGFVLNIIILSFSIGYMIFSVRFVMFFVMFASPVIVYMFLKNRNNNYKKFIAIVMIYTFTFSYYLYERRFAPYLMYVFYKNPTIEKFKDNALCANIDMDAPSPSCKVVRKTKTPNKPVNILYFASTGTNIYYAKNAEDKNYKVDFALLETTDEKDIDWKKYDYIVVPNVQENTNIRDVQKYKNAVINYNGGDKGSQVYYDFRPDLFSNCVFSNNRYKNFIWFNMPEDKMTISMCYFKHTIFQKYGFELVDKIDNFDKKFEKQLNIYKRSDK